MQLNIRKTKSAIQKTAEEVNGHFSKEDISSVQFSRSVMSDSLRPHELQHARLLVLHQLLESAQILVHQSMMPPNHFMLCSPLLLAFSLSQHQGLFQ